MDIFHGHELDGEEKRRTKMKGEKIEGAAVRFGVINAGITTEAEVEEHSWKESLKYLTRRSWIIFGKKLWERLELIRMRYKMVSFI